MKQIITPKQKGQVLNPDGTPYPPKPPTMPLSSKSVTATSGTVIENGGKYYLTPDAVVSVTATIEGGSSVNIPLVKIVAERHADDKPTGEEVYLTGSISNGELSVSGSFPFSANYKVRAERNNRALNRMGAGFNLSFDTMDFLA